MRPTWKMVVMRGYSHYITACAVCLFFVVGCGPVRPDPRQADNICLLFQDNARSYKNAWRSSQRWKIPIPVLMAIMYQESAFEPKARPPRTTCCFFLPGPRPSSAYGYAQALDITWDEYKSATNNPRARRHSFADAVDFIAWYCHLNRVKCNIAADDAYSHYLAYHEGHGGYLRRTYHNKKWLLDAAGRVKRRSELYTRQMSGCEKALRDSMRCCFFWPF